ncbi:MAG TPA: 30S ribosomal protein S2 [Patescibacteria group bacterium]|nr:30S ribosomal protein S2 [Patescibacteria group bacterium]
MTKLPTLLEMLKAGVHFGHQKSRWHPKMEPFLFGVRNGVHVIDLEKTVEELNKSLDYVRTLAAQGKVILFVGTKRQAREIVKAAAEACEMPYLVERWVGGLLTNFDEFRRRLKKYKSLKEMVATGEIERYTKKEQSDIKKDIEKMDRYLKGLTNLDRLPDALYLADVRVEKTAVTEARRVGVPMVAVCDSNVNPLKIEHPIPANDDAVNSIKLIVDLIAEAINEGRKDHEKNRAAMVVEKETKPAFAKASTGKEEMPKVAEKKAVVEDKAKKERRVIKKQEPV